jgi:hypothetical protein
MAKNLLQNTLDVATMLHDGAAASTATGNGSVGGSARILDLGTGFVKASLVIDVSAIDVASGDELYTLIVEVSSSATFASDVNQAELIRFGDSTTTGQSVDSVVGRYSRTIYNSANGETPKRYMRIRHVIAGTSPSITYSAFITNSPM